MLNRLAAALPAFVLAFGLLGAPPVQAQQITDAEFFQWQRLPEVFQVAVRITEDVEAVEELYQLCKQNEIGPGATGAVLDQLGYAVANGGDKQAALAALRAEVTSGRKGLEFAQSLAQISMFEGEGILDDNFFKMATQ